MSNTNTSPDPHFVAAKSSILEGVNSLVIGALVNDLATARVQIQQLTTQIEAMKPVPIATAPSDIA